MISDQWQQAATTACMKASFFRCNAIITHLRKRKTQHNRRAACKRRRRRACCITEDCIMYNADATRLDDDSTLQEASKYGTNCLLYTACGWIQQRRCDAQCSSWASIIYHFLCESAPRYSAVQTMRRARYTFVVRGRGKKTSLNRSETKQSQFLFFASSFLLCETMGHRSTVFEKSFASKSP